MIRFVFQLKPLRPRLFRRIGTGPDPTKDYYKEMELSPSATQADIKKQYSKLVKLYHPDRNKGTHRMTRLRHRREI